MVRRNTELLVGVPLSLRIEMSAEKIIQLSFLSAQTRRWFDTIFMLSPTRPALFMMLPAPCHGLSPYPMQRHAIVLCSSPTNTVNWMGSLFRV